MATLLPALSQIASILLEIAILVLLSRKRLYQRFFWFFLYISYELFESVLRFSVNSYLPLFYGKVYWWTEIGDVSLMVLAFGESFLNVFRIYTRLRWFVVFIWSCIGAALLYALFKALIFPPLQAKPRGTIIIDLEVAINFALGVVAILYFSLTALLRIKEYHWESGIMSGFTIYVALSICRFLIRSVYGTSFHALNTWLVPVGYLLAEATWVFELSRPERPPSIPTRELVVDDLTKLEQYSRVLERVLGRKI